MEFIHDLTGIDFGDQYFHDPELHHRQDIVLHKALHSFCLQWWPEAAEGFSKEPPYTVGVGQAFIIMSALFGSTIRYFSNFHPDCTPEPLAGVTEPGEIRVPDPASTWPVSEYLEEYDRLSALHGRDRVSLPGFGSAAMFTPSLQGLSMHSPLTTAYRLRGLELFVDMSERPAMARRIFDVIRETSYRLFDLMIARLGLRTDLMFFAACCSSLVSERIWREWELPAMKEIAGHYGAKVAIHSCGRSTHILEPAAEIEGLVELHPGGETDLRLARKHLPGVGLVVIPDSVRLSRASPEEAVAVIRGILVAGTPGTLGIQFAMEAGIRPETIVAVREAVASWEE